MNEEANAITAVTGDGTDVMTLPGGVDTNPPPKPLQQPYRAAARGLMAYLDEQGIPYQPCSEQFGLCLEVRHKFWRGVTNARIRLGASTGVVSITVWMDDLLVAPGCAWMVRRLADAVNDHCVDAQLGYSVLMQRAYARTQVWYVNADLRPRDVVAAIASAGAVLLKALLELQDMTHWHKRVDDGVEAMVRWLEDAAGRAAVETAELPDEALVDDV